MLPQVPFAAANDIVYVQPAPHEHGMMQQPPQQQVVVVMLPAQPSALTMEATQMYGGPDAVTWNSAHSFTASMAQTTRVPNLASGHESLAPVAFQPAFAHAHCQNALITCTETPAVSNTIALPAGYAADENAASVVPCQHAAVATPWLYQGMVDNSSQQNQQQLVAMHTACCFPNRTFGAEPESEPAPFCHNTIEVDDFISTASESERIYSMRERRYSTDTEYTQAGSHTKLAFHEESPRAESVSLNDFFSCASSVASSSRRRRRRRGGRRGGAGGAAMPPQAGGATSETVSAKRVVAKSRSDVAAADGEAVVLSAEDGQTLLGQLTAGGVAAHMAIAAIRSEFSIYQLAFDAVGCRIVQQALEVANAAEREFIVSELHGHVRNAMRSPHANFVIQKIVEALPVMLASFVAEELSGIAAEAARHRYGCRILCRLSEHHSDAVCPATKKLFDEVLADAAHLCHHSFARHVIDSVLEHGSADQRHQVALAINADLLHNSRNRNASYVVERAFSYCSIEDQKILASTLLRSGLERIIALAMHDCGSHVLKALLDSRCSEHVRDVEMVKQLLKAESARLELSKYGKRILEKI